MAHRQLLPDPALSVLEFLKFPFPVVSGTTSCHQISDFFSTNELTIVDEGIIQKTPTPSAEIVRDLGKICKMPTLLGAQSIICLHLSSIKGECLPLWVITFWTEVVELHSIWHEPWVQAETTLRKQNQVWQIEKGVATTHLRREVLNMLSSLSWSGNIKGFDNAEPLHHVATYITHGWLSDVHQNQMLDILHHDLTLKPGLLDF